MAHLHDEVHLHDEAHIQVRAVDDGKCASAAAKGDDARGPCHCRAKAAGGGGPVGRRSGRMRSHRLTVPLAIPSDQSVEQ